MKSDESLLKLHKKLQAMATKAARARDAFECELEHLQEQEENWRRFCELTNIASDSTSGDWLA